MRALPPAISQNGVANAASRIPGTLPGGELARGARFIVSGVHLAESGPVSIVLKHGQSSVAVKVLSAAPEEIEALAPSDAPLGSAELTVRRGSETSAPFVVRIVAAGLGLYSRNGFGWGPGRIRNLGKQDGDNSMERPARPRERVSIEATGTGADAIPSIFVGGKAADRVAIQPSREPGKQQIVFEIPAAAPEGCFVPVYAQLGDAAPSNVVTVSIRRGEGPCRFPANSPIPDLTGRHVGAVVLSRLAGMSRNGRETWTDDDAVAAFAEKTPGPAITPLLIAPPAGICTAYTGSSESTMTFPASLSAALLNQLGDLGLNAGEALNVSLGETSRVIPATPGATGYYRAPLGSSTSHRRPLFLAPGTYQLTSRGGPDAGAFELAVRGPEPFQWSNRDAIAEIRRDRPLPLTWSPARPGQTMVILAMSVDPLTTARALAYCIADGGAGRFTIPAQMLAHFPATGDVAGPPYHQLMLATLTSNAAAARSIRGLDNLSAVTAFVSARVVEYR